ncbi:hypothetical protein [Otoolea muris]|uniref:hypothetical protein n=1 Tax=Otoolea muris TaxID=2941515 RepID=UPI00203E8572|nr:hypothetical protein [Otoolea muris]
MGLDERALGNASAAIAYGLMGVLSLIPALQEIGLDRKLNEDKTGLEKNGFHPDLVARHIRDNGAVFIGCGQEVLEPIRQELTQGGIPFIFVASSMIEDEGKRPPYFYTVVIRDIDGQRAAGLLEEVLKKRGREDGLEEEQDLERGIGDVGLADNSTDPDQEEAQENQQEDGDGSRDGDDAEMDEGEEQYKRKKEEAAKRKAGRRKERRLEEERKRQEKERARKEENYRNRTSAAEITFAVNAVAQPSRTDYPEAYAIRAIEIEEQCGRYEKAELMRRELERMKLSGEDGSEGYRHLKYQYQSINDDIQAHHDRFQSIGKGGWQEYAAETARRAREASTESLLGHAWDMPDGVDYLRRNQDGSYRGYTREEKKACQDGKYRNEEANVTLHGYAQEAVRHEALKCQEELAGAERRAGAENLEHYKSLLEKHNVADQEGTAAQDPSSAIRGHDSRPASDFREQKFSRSAYEALPEPGTAHREEKAPVLFTRAGAEKLPLKQIADGNTIRAFMVQQGSEAGNCRGMGAPCPDRIYGSAGRAAGGSASVRFIRYAQGKAAPACGGILAGVGMSVIGGGSYRKKGSAALEEFQRIANRQMEAKADSRPPASSDFTENTVRTRAASAMAMIPKPAQENAGPEGGRNGRTVKVRNLRQDSLKRIGTGDVRTRRAAADMVKNRYFSMIVRQGARAAIQSATGDTGAGRIAVSAMYAVKLPAHIVKQQMLNAGRASLDQGDAVMTALNSHIIRSRAAAASGLQGEALERFARQSGLAAGEIKAIRHDRAAMERLVARRYTGTFGIPGKKDMEGIIRAMGIRGDLKKGDAIGTEDILGFLSRHGETTLAERSRALKNAGGNLEGLSGGQKRLVESLFSRGKFPNRDSMKADLEKNGVSRELADKLAGGNWASNGDILEALKQAGIQEDKTGALMKELKGVSMEDRAAMIGLFQLYAGDSLSGFDMDKFRDLLNVLDVDQALKDGLGRNYIHLSHMSMEDIRKLIAKYRENPEAEAFLNRLLNEKICLTLGRNREISRMELINGVESFLFRMARGTDAMSGFSQVMSLTRGMTRTARSGYRLLYNMAFRRMTAPIGIGKLKAAPADLTAANMKAAAAAAVKQTRIAATFSKMMNRRAPQGLKRVAGHVLHPGRFIGQAVGKKVEWILLKHGVDTLALKAGVKAAAGKLTAAAAAASEFLLAAAAVILAIIILLMAYEGIDPGGNGNSEGNDYSAAYVSAADGKDAFLQEAVDMLRGYTDDFIRELNDAQYNRGLYAGMNGFNTNEGVASFEAGAYQVVFCGPDGEPIDDITSVDLNNSKDIISMASVFIPTIFNKPGENASVQAIAEYEKDKEHFLDYCTFLWAASHQISIEEYHPGNASNPDANDSSGLETDARTGRCGMDYELNGDQGAGVNWWIGTGASPASGEICGVCARTDWYDTDITEHACASKPAADPCTHGHWQTVATPLKHRACKGHHHHCSRHDYWYSCADKGKTKWDKDRNVYKRVWVCDGHMGAVVYATIGRISRMPNFGAAKDYDFDSPETYGGGGGIYSYFGGSGGEGGTAFHGNSYSLTDAQLKYLAAMCMGEQRTCATNEVTMRYQASLMANVYELYGKKKGLSIYEYLTLLPTQKKNGVSGWFATASHTYADKNVGSVSAQCVEWVRDVFCNGNRITKANEQGTLITGFVKAVYQGKTYAGNAMKNESIYVPGETILYTSGGQACLFEAFPGGHPAGCGTPVVDPFAIIIN